MTTIRKAPPTIESLNTFIFEGIDGEECEDLIHAVRLHARDVNKLRDHDYMARWASACMVGDALRWHVTLPEEVKYNWEKLERALLVEHPLNEEASSRSRRLRPGTVRRGRIKIVCDDPSQNAYISSGPAASKYALPTSSASDALNVEWSTPPDGGASRLRLLNQAPFGGIAHDLLGASFRGGAPLEQGDDSWGNLTAAIASEDGTITFAQEYAGPRSVDIWRVAQDNSISMYWNQGGQNHDLIVAVYPTGKRRRLIVTRPCNLAEFDDEYVAARLVLEPIL